jgi:hypothetical protein
MLETRVGGVVSCETLDSGTLLLEVEAEGTRHRALAYRSLTGDIREGDRVLLNTTAGTLGLGTGGFDFVVANLSRPAGVAGAGQGHIIKLRYTPHQFAVLADEEAQPELYSRATDLGGMPPCPSASPIWCARSCRKGCWTRPSPAGRLSAGCARR